MANLLIHWRALSDFIRQLWGFSVPFYRERLKYHRDYAGVAALLRDGFTPEKLARDGAQVEGVEIGSARYQELLELAREIQREVQK